MDKDALRIVHSWWQSMFLNADQLKNKGIMPAPTVYRAQLRRCSKIDAVMLSEGFRRLWLALPDTITAEYRPEIIEKWAAIAGALVFVTTDSDVNLARAAGTKGDGDNSIVSELRFAQLQNSRTPDDFLRRLRRILKQIDGSTSVRQLTQDIHLWFLERNHFRPRTPTNRIAVRWAMDYYQAAQ